MARGPGERPRPAGRGDCRSNGLGGSQLTYIRFDLGLGGRYRGPLGNPRETRDRSGPLQTPTNRTTLRSKVSGKAQTALGIVRLVRDVRALPGRACADERVHGRARRHVARAPRPSARQARRVPARERPEQPHASDRADGSASRGRGPHALDIRVRRLGAQLHVLAGAPAEPARGRQPDHRLSRCRRELRTVLSRFGMGARRRSRRAGDGYHAAVSVEPASAPP